MQLAPAKAMMGSVHLLMLCVNKTSSELENTAYHVPPTWKLFSSQFFFLIYLFSQHFSSFLLVGNTRPSSPLKIATFYFPLLGPQAAIPSHLESELERLVPYTFSLTNYQLHFQVKLGGLH